MKVQNHKHMGKRGTTDVLSFPHTHVEKKDLGKVNHFNKKHLGDILISVDQAKIQAKLQGISLQKELIFLSVHSILHLIGYDHANPTEQESMQKQESKVWRKLYKI